MHQSESIILSKKTIGEADLLITFFSREDGKISGVAQHAKKSKKRFGNVLESGHVINLNYTFPSASNLARVNEASLVSPKVYTSPSLEHTTALWLSLEFARRFLPDAEVGREKYELLRRFVVATHERRLTRPILMFFLIKWISLCGYQPDLAHCVKCKTSEVVFFSASLGGLLCRNCWSDKNPTYQFKPASIEVLRKIMSGDIKFDINEVLYEDLLRFVFYYSMVLLGKPLELEAYLPVLAGLK